MGVGAACGVAPRAAREGDAGVRFKTALDAAFKFVDFVGEFLITSTLGEVDITN